MCNVCVVEAPIVHYQNQQRIWNTVRIDSSEYTMNKVAISTKPKVWNQQSDRPLPHSQVAIPSHGNSTKRTLTRNRPGACAPGGVGCDIKFNSYVRYLNRLKGRSLKDSCKGVGKMYGGKYYNTVISPCYPSGVAEVVTIDPIIQPPSFAVGDYVTWNGCYAKILDIINEKAVAQIFDKYGNAKNIDIISLQGLNYFCGFESDALLQSSNYFINSLDNI